ncbi:MULTISPECIES: FAD:protein FMN transferase [Clostridium]|jgi:FAD:protein FMN transferase|uniref:FAD:protein FMN transferase n=1 Tax=Clostridium thermopalmarium DSM 5974 TaxID=1121340 RepID=A0A2T0AR47_9CLOT|nr:FAD:protein FMN transferase [Clostridium thermopalmarium]MBE6043880.1 FAD:protein FMN transferase [Clostridium thermopalmarium]PRR72025.1 Thiamine biosynthesis lipoprotein ApbE precursor [Clostridium thermopalmarium DSM 5974]PVZ23677.1 thiamine biosynthesis lipoprotein [Clostridium thermopalmarium DSM 5974]
MNNIKKVLLVLTIFISSISMVACTKNNSSEPISRTNFFMGTVVKISLYDKKDQNIISKGFDRIRQIESEVSINKQGTELDKVNEAAGKKPVKVKDDTFAITKKGLEYSELTKGSFDITVGPIVKLWSIGLPEAKVPTKSEVDEKIKLVGYKDLQLNEKDKTIFLKKKEMIIDLGAIAKGYAADAVAEVLKNEGVKSAIIDLGGNVFALGTKPDGELWKIGIQNPFQSRGEIVGTIYVENKSVVTSGIYERFIEKDGKKYHHILNPFTGYPYDNEIAGVTIISDKSIDGDALSTSVFSKGLKGGIDFIENIKNVDAIFITKDKKVYVTEGIKDNFKITNDEFTLVN